MIVDLSLTFLITVQTGTFCRTLSRTCTLICALAKFERLLPLGTFQQKIGAIYESAFRKTWSQLTS